MMSHVQIINKACGEKKGRGNSFRFEDGGDHIVHFPESVIESQQKRLLGQDLPSLEMVYNVRQTNRRIVYQKKIQVFQKLLYVSKTIQVLHMRHIIISHDVIVWKDWREI